MKAFTNEAYEESRYRTGINEVVAAVLRGALFRGAFSAFVIFALFGAVVLVLWAGARQVRAGDLSLGDLTQFLLYTLYVGGAVGSFAELYAQLQRTVGATQRVPRTPPRDRPRTPARPARCRGRPGPSPSTT